MDPARAAAAAAAGDAVYTIPKAAEYINKAPERVTQRTAGGIRAGPLANPSGGHVRIISRMDYAPDVCKDFKETGFCGYGDSCIFMHDRSGMKHGPQVERIWETVQQKHMAAQRRGAAAATSASAAAADVATDRPFACHICRKPFTSPVMTKCGHYFCETCILGCYRKSKACPVCSAGLDGVFRPARDLPPPPVASS
ncbi:hypothetical protein CXG81DRAFT_10397 [Caulochytrium protostelioides]|uniref:Pre-mRNA-splicing factor CWC24 n=1 Tax=Caulochytrium protostelioides TaxID=1555241 RepID=A0A4P9XCD4_9FUNG|nr:hypothetical protein CXG81DRAFT_10397 [Caulochytrium protostelioides]|eukprot:RKP02801.1 hypothetical protein CXG81DRAFT_10397 [Caulochytrium protostelioides]